MKSIVRGDDRDDTWFGARVMCLKRQMRMRFLLPSRMWNKFYAQSTLANVTIGLLSSMSPAERAVMTVTHSVIQN